MRSIQIERKQRLDPGRFVREHMSAPGKPVIVTDAMEGWPALQKWTWQFLRTRFGKDFATAPTGLGHEFAKLTTVSAYLDFLEKPESGLQGFWVESRSGRPVTVEPPPDENPAYLLGWQAFQTHPELYSDISPAPYFAPDWVLSLPPELIDQLERASGREYWAIYIGPVGAVSKLHCDFWGTHACLAQVRGRKRVFLFAPEDSRLVYDGRADPEAPDLGRHPLLADAIVYEGTIGPGDILYIPPDWWHCVRTIESSITVSHNFFNATNVGAHVGQLGPKFPELARALVEFASASSPGRDGARNYPRRVP